MTAELIKKFKKVTIKGVDLEDVVRKFKDKYSDWKLINVDYDRKLVYLAKNGYKVVVGFYIDDFYNGILYVCFYLHSIYRE